MIKSRKKSFRIFNSKFFLLKSEKNYKYDIYFKNSIGFLKYKLLPEFFLKKRESSNHFFFNKKKIFKNFINHFFFFSNKFFRFFFIKLRLRGLGYRIRKITRKLYKFFFAFNHYFYFHISPEIFVKHRRRLLLLSSNNLVKLNDIFSHLLLLKKIDLYERNNTFIIGRKILFFKKRK